MSDSCQPVTRVQMAHPCKSCPFRRERTYSIPPDLLESTVGENMRSGVYLHRCHTVQDGKTTCAGNLAFLKHRGELNNFALWRLGQANGLLRDDAIDTTTPMHSSWEELVESHREATHGKA